MSILQRARVVFFLRRKLTLNQAKLTKMIRIGQIAAAGFGTHNLAIRTNDFSKLFAQTEPPARGS
jgi:hypothetical protein